MNPPDCLAATGVDLSLLIPLVAVGLIVIGAVVVAARRPGKRALPLLFLAPFAIGVLVLGIPAGPASAATGACGEAGGVPAATAGPSATAVPSPTPSPTETPTLCPPAAIASDKSDTIDTDGDGIVNACDLDSDNDGVLDTEEDSNSNGLYDDNDVDGDLLVIPTLGDGVPNYLDLDSENDGVLDLMEGRTFTRAQIDYFDTNHDGVIDPSFSFGTNGLLDDLETSADSGVLATEFQALRNTDGDDKVDFVDARSNNVAFDLYTVGQEDLDQYGLGFISPIVDVDGDGIMDQIDTDTGNRGAPGSPYSVYSS